MDEKQLQALANELAKNLKTPEDLSQFDRLLKKISVESALNAEMTHHLGYEKNQSRQGTNSRNGYWGSAPISSKSFTLIIKTIIYHVVNRHIRTQYPRYHLVGLLPPKDCPNL